MTSNVSDRCSNVIGHPYDQYTLSKENDKKKIQNEFEKVNQFFDEHYGFQRTLNRDVTVERASQCSQWECAVDGDDLKNIPLAYFRDRFPSQGFTGDAYSLRLAMPVILSAVYNRNWLIEGRDLTQFIGMQTKTRENLTSHNSSDLTGFIGMPLADSLTLHNSYVLSHVFCATVLGVGDDDLITISKVWFKAFQSMSKEITIEKFACLTIASARAEKHKLLDELRKSWLKVGVLKVPRVPLSSLPINRE
ncbi:putative uncharacterized protein [Parachlamydia acanthamoebae UV-7]|uniref:Uncharacterized protein n=2 Tax=Parachlamydia acanthamoebae TaxID=83552 RepID=F8L2M3_PARAV|nr:hypothetical protein [Parachlamydia acanthamoebae]KIA76742.1 hypothetical protein DB43_HK00150 [Parachlamydia acanthamoebae]CCB87550.1 putative uncharacterized protein [Parachlamydia acanthamoebae UV-7]